MVLLDPFAIVRSLFGCPYRVAAPTSGAIAKSPGRLSPSFLRCYHDAVTWSGHSGCVTSAHEADEQT